MENSEKKKDAKDYPTDLSQYIIGEEIGSGVASLVYRAKLVEDDDEEVAIKIMDLERYSSKFLMNLTQEISIMSSCAHTNVVKYYTSFVYETNLYIVTEILEGGSIYDIMRFKFREGFEDEEIIASILKQVLQALKYFHSNGHIHRDIKASNVLFDSEATVRIADFGVSACLMDSGDRRKSRQTLVGTPCWMAPEVLEQVSGYDFKADIWSLGITAIELAEGRAPFSEFTPMKVMYMTLNQPPPTLANPKKYSKPFKDMIDACLQKDPKKRPTAALLLKHKFFLKAKKNILKQKVLDGLPPLTERVKLLKHLEKNQESEALREQIANYNSVVSTLPSSHQKLKSQTNTHKDSSKGSGSDMSHGETSNDEVQPEERERKRNSGWRFDDVVAKPETEPKKVQSKTAPKTNNEFDELDGFLGDSIVVDTKKVPIESTNQTDQPLLDVDEIDSKPTSPSSVTSSYSNTSVGNNPRTSGHFTSASAHEMFDSLPKEQQDQAKNGTISSMSAPNSPKSGDSTNAKRNKEKEKVRKGRFWVQTIDDKKKRNSKPQGTPSPVDSTQNEFGSSSSLKKKKTGRKFDVKDVDPSAIPPKQPLPDQNKTRGRSSMNLEKQMNFLLSKYESQIKIINAIWANQQQMINNEKSAKTYKEENKTELSEKSVRSMESLQLCIDQLIKENILLRNENEALKGHNEKLKSQVEK